MSEARVVERKPRVLLLSVSSGKRAMQTTCWRRGPRYAAITCRRQAWKIAMLPDQPERLASMKRAASKLARPEAARKIVEDALGLLH